MRWACLMLPFAALAARAQISITTPSLPDGAVNVQYSLTMSSSGATPPLIWTATGLPPGLTISAGTITGFPTATGVYTVTVNLREVNANRTTSRQYSLTIFPEPMITTPVFLPDATVGFSYSVQLQSNSAGTWELTGIGARPPPGLTLTSGGLLSGIPTEHGGYAISIDLVTPLVTVNGRFAMVYRTFRLTIHPRISAAPSSLRFSGNAGGDAPGPQNLVITSASTGVPFSVQVDDGKGGPAPPWLVLPIRNGTTVAVVSVSVSPAGLSAGTYSARIRFTGEAGSMPTDIPVTLTLVDAPPSLSVQPTLLHFTATRVSTAPQEQTITLRNAGGGGPIPFSAAIVSNSPWISGISASSDSVPAPGAAFLAVTVNPVGLQPGSYTESIRLRTASGDTLVPVSIFISGGGAALNLSAAGLTIPAVQGSLNARIFPVTVYNVGDPGTTVTWTAQVLRGQSLLSLTTPQGSSTSIRSSTFGVQLTAAATATAGPKFALVEITAPQAQQSTQYLTVVVNVGDPGFDQAPDPAPAGLVFVAPAAGSPAAQSVLVHTSSMNALTMTVSTSTDDGADWLRAAPSTANTSNANPASISVSVAAAQLPAGIYHGRVNVAFGVTVRSVNVALVRLDNAGVAESQGARDAACVPSALALIQTGLTNNYSVRAGWPAVVSAQVLNDCGNPVRAASVVASFSNGDPPLTLAGDPYSTSFSATWQPRSAGEDITVRVDATFGSLRPDSVQVSGNLSANSLPAPSLLLAGLLNNLNPVPGGALAPGTVTQVYGDNLATAPQSAASLPLQTIVQGVEAVIGGLSAPIYFIGKTQLTIQIPSELTPNRTHYAILAVNNQFSLPQPLDLVPYAPGTLAFPDGGLVAQHQDFTLVDSTNPAKPGEPLVIYLVGMGATNPPVPSGFGSPFNPPAEVISRIQLTVDGQTADVRFAGLTPGGVGLYQINFFVPANARAGNLDVVITQEGVKANTTKLLVGP
jgi:uncharacterized protein (TIGR03437 family)